jgi:hypothetical protein
MAVIEAIGPWHLLYQPKVIKDLAFYHLLWKRAM